MKENGTRVSFPNVVMSVSSSWLCYKERLITTECLLSQHNTTHTHCNSLRFSSVLLLKTETRVAEIMELQKTPTSLVFGINGERFELSHVHPSTTLLEFLRIHTRFKSAKLGCGEGTCISVVLCVQPFFIYWRSWSLFIRLLHCRISFRVVPLHRCIWISDLFYFLFLPFNFCKLGIYCRDSSFPFFFVCKINLGQVWF